ncbi:MAG: hypothetical protein L0Y32_04100 [Nevskiales bacterium]|nr:hypothetical protein [Nevskiales bacterium]
MIKITAFVQRLAHGLVRTLPSRLKAAGVHLALSALIFAGALYLILVRWYPGFHFTVDGGWQGVRIMVVVDLVLGPLLTLIIFNPFKARKLIVFDLGCLALTQFAALVWGFYAVHSQHPVSVNYSDGTFHSMTVAPLQIEKYPRSLPGELSDRRPALIYVAPPANDGERTRAAMMEIMGSVAPYEDPFFFRSFEPHWETVKASAIDAQKRVRSDAAFAAGLERFLAGRGGAATDYFFFPYAGRYGTCTLAFSAAGELLDALGCQAF